MRFGLISVNYDLRDLFDWAEGPMRGFVNAKQETNRTDTVARRA